MISFYISKEKEETTKEKLVKGKQTTKKVEEKGRKSGGSSSIRSKKSKGPAIKDPLQQEKDRIKAVKEQEKRVSKQLFFVKHFEGFFMFIVTFSNFSSIS